MSLSLILKNPVIIQILKDALKTAPNLLANLGLPELSKFLDKYQMWADHKEEKVLEIGTLKRGDILSRRLCGVFRHTAVYVGKGEIIHISGGESKKKGDKILRREPLLLGETFVKKEETFYKVTFTEQVRTGEEVALAAEVALNGKWDSYNILKNNCQHFATHCALGECSVIESISTIISKFISVILPFLKFPVLIMQNVITELMACTTKLFFGMREIFLYTVVVLLCLQCSKMNDYLDFTTVIIAVYIISLATDLTVCVVNPVAGFISLGTRVILLLFINSL